MVRKKLPKNDMEMYIPPGSSLPHTVVKVTKAAKNSANLASHIEKEKNNTRKEKGGVHRRIKKETGI